MKWHVLNSYELTKAISIGIAVSILTAVFMVGTFKAGISPLPESLGLAFAEKVIERPLPLPVGLLFHTVWTTAFSVLYVILFRDVLTFTRAAGLAVLLWLSVLVFFFPVVGWGFLGLAVSPRLIVGAAIPHFLFAVFLWGLRRWMFPLAVNVRHV